MESKVERNEDPHENGSSCSPQWAVKLVVLSGAGRDPDIRRVAVPNVDTFTYADLIAAVRAATPPSWAHDVDNRVSVQYEDDEGEVITVASDGDLKAAFHVARSPDLLAGGGGLNTLRLTVSHVTGSGRGFNLASQAAAGLDLQAATGRRRYDPEGFTSRAETIEEKDTDPEDALVTGMRLLTTSDSIARTSCKFCHGPVQEGSSFCSDECQATSSAFMAAQPPMPSASSPPSSSYEPFSKRRDYSSRGKLESQPDFNTGGTSDGPAFASSAAFTTPMNGSFSLGMATLTATAVTDQPMSQHSAGSSVHAPSWSTESGDGWSNTGFASTPYARPTNYPLDSELVSHAASHFTPSSSSYPAAPVTRAESSAFAAQPSPGLVAHYLESATPFHPSGGFHHADSRVSRPPRGSRQGPGHANVHPRYQRPEYEPSFHGGHGEMYPGPSSALTAYGRGAPTDRLGGLDVNPCLETLPPSFEAAYSRQPSQEAAHTRQQPSMHHQAPLAFHRASGSMPPGTMQYGSMSARGGSFHEMPAREKSSGSILVETLSGPRPMDSLPLSEPSVCVPWVSPEVGRDLIQSTFEQFGEVKQIDLVPREDHYLCFIHFIRWKIEDHSNNELRVRLLLPPSLDFKESVNYQHPVSGPQRWLFSRSRVPPRITRPRPTPAATSKSRPLPVGPPGMMSPLVTPPNEPSVCVPWVRHHVTRELLEETFSTFGKVRQVDLVAKGDHYLCFVHFHAWNLDDPEAVAVRNRLLNPPTADHRESVYYRHPTWGRQRWLFARSWGSSSSSSGSSDVGFGTEPTHMAPSDGISGSRSAPSTPYFSSSAPVSPPFDPIDGARYSSLENHLPNTSHIGDPHPGHAVSAREGGAPFGYGRTSSTPTTDIGSRYSSVSLDSGKAPGFEGYSESVLKSDSFLFGHHMGMPNPASGMH